MSIRFNPESIPYVITAGSTEQLAQRMQANAARFHGLSYEADARAAELTDLITKGVLGLAENGGHHQLYRQQYVEVDAAGREWPNGAISHSRALLCLLGHRPDETPNRMFEALTLLRRQIVNDEVTGSPARKFEWRGAGILRIKGCPDILALDGKVQRFGGIKDKGAAGLTLNASGHWLTCESPPANAC